MPKRKKGILILGVVSIVAILFLTFGTPSYQAIKVKNKNFTVFENKLKEAVNKNSEIDLKKLTDFDWDECYVFTPYYPPKEIYEKVGTEWTTARTYIRFILFHGLENKTVNDDQYLIAFKKDSKVILSAVYSIEKLPVVFKLDNYMFTSSNAKFIVSTYANQYDEGKIKELTIKE